MYWWQRDASLFCRIFSWFLFVKLKLLVQVVCCEVKEGISLISQLCLSLPASMHSALLTKQDNHKSNLDLLTNYSFLAITCQPLTLDGQSRALKTRIFAKRNVKEKISKLPLEYWVFLPGPNDVIKILWPQTVVTSHQKSSNPKVPGFFKIEARKLTASSESLNSSLALSVGKLWLDKVRTTIVVLWSVKGWSFPGLFLTSPLLHHAGLFQFFLPLDRSLEPCRHKLRRDVVNSEIRRPRKVDQDQGSGQRESDWQVDQGDEGWNQAFARCASKHIFAGSFLCEMSPIDWRSRLAWLYVVFTRLLPVTLPKDYEQATVLLSIIPPTWIINFGLPILAPFHPKVTKQSHSSVLRALRIENSAATLCRFFTLVKFRPLWNTYNELSFNKGTNQFWDPIRLVCIPIVNIQQKNARNGTIWPQPFGASVYLLDYYYSIVVVSRNVCFTFCSVVFQEGNKRCAFVCLEMRLSVFLYFRTITKCFFLNIKKSSFRFGV